MTKKFSTTVHLKDSEYNVFLTAEENIEDDEIFYSNITIQEINGLSPVVEWFSAKFIKEITEHIDLESLWMDELWMDEYAA